MLLFIGYLIVVGATLAGFMHAGGKPLALLHVSEFIIIGGIALGVLIISSPASTLINLLKQIATAIKGEPVKPSEFMDVLKMLYELFSKARRGGLIAIEDDIVTPSESPIITKYPSFLRKPERVQFLADCLRPIIDGRVKPEHLQPLIEGDLEAKDYTASKPVSVLSLVGDSLPGIGIIGAVLGIINTMAAVSEGPEKVGLKVAAALTGTFLGVFGAYGFVNPLAERIRQNNALLHLYYTVIMKGVVGFANGMAPVMAVEIARRSVDQSMQPSAETLEEILKQLTVAANQPKQPA